MEETWQDERSGGIFVLSEEIGSKQKFSKWSTAYRFILLIACKQDKKTSVPDILFCFFFSLHVYIFVSLLAVFLKCWFDKLWFLYH